MFSYTTGYPHELAHARCVWTKAAFREQAPPERVTPRWQRELRLLRRDGLVKYLRVLRHYRRFQKAVRRLGVDDND